jgi:hypothetical protein
LRSARLPGGAKGAEKHSSRQASSGAEKNP